MSKSPKPEGETSEQAFLRLGSMRVRKAIKAIGLVKNLHRYDHNASQTQKIVDALKRAVEDVEYALGGQNDEATNEFNF